MVFELENRFRDVRAAAGRVVCGVTVRILHGVDGDLAAEYGLDFLREVEHWDFRFRIADVVRLARYAMDEHLEKAGDGVGDVTERARLLAGAVNLERPVGLDVAGEI